MTTILRNEVRTARKEHKCFWCGLTIPKGVEYVSEAQVFDGEFNAFKAHTCCAELAKEFFRDSDYLQDYGMSPNDFLSEVRERNGEILVVPLRDELELAKRKLGITQTF